MLRAFKILASLVSLLLVVGIIVYLLPSTIKVKGMEALTGIVPASIKEKANEFLLSPAEKRTKILTTLTSKLHALENNTLTENEVKNLAKEAQVLVTQLGAQNGERSFTEIAKEKLVEKLVGEANQCVVQK